MYHRHAQSQPFATINQSQSMPTSTQWLLTAVLVATLRFGAGAQAPASAPVSVSVPGPVLSPAFGPVSSAPPPALDCTNYLLNSSSCLTFVEAGSNLTVPETGCCGSLASLVDNQPICLCQLLAGGDTYGLQIDITKALKLPNVCHVQTPPVSLCAVLGIPVASPTGPSPSPSTGGAPEAGFGAPAGSIPTSGISGVPAAAPSSNGVGSAVRFAGLAAFLAVGLPMAVAVNVF